MSSRRYSAADARKDVSRKSAAQLDRESALKWAALAIEALRRHAAGEGQRFLLKAQVWEHEALEHAAGVSGAFRDAIKRRIDKVRSKIRGRG